MICHLSFPSSLRDFSRKAAACFYRVALEGKSEQYSVRLNEIEKWKAVFVEDLFLREFPHLKRTLGL